MSEFKDLLFNVLIVLLPIFLFQSLWAEKSTQWSRSRHRAVISLFSILSLLLVMTVPVRLVPGFLFDLRLVPMVIGILYGGYRGGAVLVAAFFLYRFAIGGVGALYMSLTFPLMFLLAFLLIPYFPRYARRTKVLVAMGLALLELVILVVVALWQMHDQMQIPPLSNPLIPFFLCLTAITLLCLFIAVYLLESTREKEVMRYQMHRNAKWQGIGELTASMAHELRNPLTVVRGFLQLLQRDGVDPKKRETFLKMGIEELDRSESIIRNYLSYAKPQFERMEAVDVCERITHVTGIISPFATLRGVMIDTVCEHNLSTMADPEQLSQVLMNLIKNGIEAMPEGGAVTVRAYKRSRQLIIEIADSGVGMTPDELTKLGNPFFTTKESGTGLGLMVCYQIIHSINGCIDVQSEKGKGTQFTLLLPAL